MLGNGLRSPDRAAIGKSHTVQMWRCSGELRDNVRQKAHHALVLCMMLRTNMAAECRHQAVSSAAMQVLSCMMKQNQAPASTCLDKTRLGIKPLANC
jgi:hypothetical protein